MAHSRLTEAVLVIKEEMGEPGKDLTITIPADFGVEPGPVNA